jgi:hypothetical protein
MPTTRLGETRGLVGRRAETPIASAALAAAGDGNHSSSLSQIAEKRPMIAVVDKRAERHGDDQILAAEPGHFLAHPPDAALGVPVMLPGKIEQRVLGMIGQKNNRSPIPPIAAVRPALGHIFLAAEGDAPVPAVTGFHVDNGFIDEHTTILCQEAGKFS